MSYITFNMSDRYKQDVYLKILIPTHWLHNDDFPFHFDWPVQKQICLGKK